MIPLNAVAPRARTLNGVNLKAGAAMLVNTNAQPNYFGTTLPFG
jgi:hypothetical protein